MELNDIIDLGKFPIESKKFMQDCKKELDKNGVLVMPGFMQEQAVNLVKQEGETNKDKAYFCQDNHTVYLSEPDPQYDTEHARNRMVVSSKGCICDDVVPTDSPLRTLYDSESFRAFMCHVLGEEELHEYADPLSSINLHYAEKGQELGWHFDNSSFAITLMIQPTVKGGDFEFVRDVRDADKGEMNFEGVTQVLNGETEVNKLNMPAGALVLFRGRNSIHRVAPNEGDVTRMLVVLAYNSEPGVSLSEEARMTFFGRVN